MSTKEILGMIARRLREPSTWASVAALLGLLRVTSGTDPGLEQTLNEIGIGVAAAIGLFLREGPKPPPPPAPIVTVNELPPPAAS